MNIYPCDRCWRMAPDCTCRRATNPRVVADVHRRHREAREAAWRSGWAAGLAVARQQRGAAC